MHYAEARGRRMGERALSVSSQAVTLGLGAVVFVLAVVPPDVIWKINMFAFGGLETAFFWVMVCGPVSYTHLDVYKRQMMYKSELHSYRDLPLRYFEFGTVYRHEMSGVVHGLLRARGFTQDDAHVFCTRDQVVDEVVAILDLVDHIMSTFGFQYEAEISTRPEKSIGTDDMWEHATNALKEACARHELAYDINEGDGAFYGPKIDIKVKDAIGRTWQCSTVQVD